MRRGTPQEQDFMSRLEAFQKAGDMPQLRTIWYFGHAFKVRIIPYALPITHSCELEIIATVALDGASKNFLRLMGWSDTFH